MESKNIISLPVLDELVKELRKIQETLAELKHNVSPEREFYDLKTACQLKGANYHTVASKHKFQPNNGTPDAHVGGRRMWRKETIMKWIKMGDDELEVFNKAA